MMTKLFSVVFALVFCFSAHAAQFEISTLAGSANPNMDFVRDTVKRQVKLVPGHSLVDHTTAMVYFASRNGAQSIQTVQNLSDQGSGTTENLIRAVDLAARSSVIVLNVAGGGDMEYVCARMRMYPNTVFLSPGGSNASYENGADKPSCYAPNIVFVNGLNRDLTDLAGNQNFGPLARLAVPYVSLSAPVGEDRSITFSSKAFGMAMAAGKMAELHREDASLTGAALIDRFFGEKTSYLRTLERKIAGARALLDVAY
jgi:hypothetical protein